MMSAGLTAPLVGVVTVALVAFHMHYDLSTYPTSVWWQRTGSDRDEAQEPDAKDVAEDVWPFDSSDQAQTLEWWHQRIRNGVPTVLREMAKHEIHSWTPNQLSRVSGHMMLDGAKVQVGDEEFHHYNVDKPLAAYNESSPRFQEGILSLRDFLSSISSNDQFWYFSGSIAFVGQTFVDLSRTFHNLLANDEAVSDNIWLSGKGVTAYSHYDTSHNTYVQLHGTKTFYIVPPDEWKNLVPYPSLHPFYRQTQKSLLQSQVVEKVTLFPGDVFYLPPYWLHHVVSETVSVSINFWSDSKEYVLSEAIMTASVPFELEWTSSQLLNAFRRYISLLSEALSMQHVPSTIMDRYQYLGFSNPSSLRVSCDATDDDMEDYAPFSKLREGMQRIVPYFMDIEASVQGVVYSNFVEHLADWVAVTIQTKEGSLQDFTAFDIISACDTLRYKR